MPLHRHITSLHDSQPVGVLHRLPLGERRGGLVLLQEIFGLDAHMQADAARWAEAGYEVLAPSLFDRCESGFAAAHDGPGIARGMAYLQNTPDAQALGDIAACIQLLAPAGPVVLLGYCYGGRLAWSAAACLPHIAAAVTYYGNVLPQIEPAPRSPVMLHFGAKDPHLPVAAIHAALQQHHPGLPVHLYAESGHGFNNSGAADANPADAELARERTRHFFERHRADSATGSASAA